MESEAEEARILVLSHCILNQATRWRQNGRKRLENQGPVTPVLRVLSAHKIGAVQLPCPEFTFSGNPRPPRTRDGYENLSGFRLHCERLAEDSAHHLKTLVTQSRSPKVRILAIVGVERSPSCGVTSTPRTVDGETRYVGGRGLFIEILENEMERLGLEAPIIGLDLHKPVDFCRRLRAELGIASGR